MRMSVKGDPYVRRRSGGGICASFDVEVGHPVP